MSDNKSLLRKLIIHTVVPVLSGTLVCGAAYADEVIPQFSQGTPITFIADGKSGVEGDGNITDTTSQSSLEGQISDNAVITDNAGSVNPDDYQGNGNNGAGDNGTGANGTGANGTGANGTGANGTGANGTGTNGTGTNGTGANGTGTNGTGANGTGTNGTGANGTGNTPQAMAQGYKEDVWGVFEDVIAQIENENGLTEIEPGVGMVTLQGEGKLTLGQAQKVYGSVTNFAELYENGLIPYEMNTAGGIGTLTADTGLIGTYIDSIYQNFADIYNGWMADGMNGGNVSALGNLLSLRIDLSGFGNIFGSYDTLLGITKDGFKNFNIDLSGFGDNVLDSYDTLLGIVKNGFAGINMPAGTPDGASDTSVHCMYDVLADRGYFIGDIWTGGAMYFYGYQVHVSGVSWGRLPTDEERELHEYVDSQLGFCTGCSIVDADNNIYFLTEDDFDDPYFAHTGGEEGMYAYEERQLWQEVREDHVPEDKGYTIDAETYLKIIQMFDKAGIDIGSLFGAEGIDFASIFGGEMTWDDEAFAALGGLLEGAGIELPSLGGKLNLGDIDISTLLGMSESLLGVLTGGLGQAGAVGSLIGDIGEFELPSTITSSDIEVFVPSVFEGIYNQLVSQMLGNIGSIGTGFGNGIFGDNDADPEGTGNGLSGNNGIDIGGTGSGLPGNNGTGNGTGWPGTNTGGYGFDSSLFDNWLEEHPGEGITAETAKEIIKQMIENQQNNNGFGIGTHPESWTGRYTAFEGYASSSINDLCEVVLTEQWQLNRIYYKEVSMTDYTSNIRRWNVYKNGVLLKTVMTDNAAHALEVTFNEPGSYTIFADQWVEETMAYTAEYTVVKTLTDKKTGTILYQVTQTATKGNGDFALKTGTESTGYWAETGLYQTFNINNIGELINADYETGVQRVK